MKWKFKYFVKSIGKSRLVRQMTADDRRVALDLAMVFGGKYWAIVGGGVIRLPGKARPFVPSKKFKFSDWAEPTLGDNVAPATGSGGGS